MNRISLLIMSFSLLTSAVAIGIALHVNNKINNVIVVDAIVLFNEFEMKKELEANVDKELVGYSQQIDSLTAIRKQLIENNDYESIKSIEAVIYDKNAQARNAYEVSNKNINEQVWKRLNHLIDEYGQENNVRVIIGANGMGSVMYTENQINKTSEVVEFVNRKYERGI